MMPETTSTADTPLLQTQGLTLRIGGKALVTQLDWQVRRGECWCVIGRNGVGKSSLLRTLAGLPSANSDASGSVAIGGRLLAQWPLAALALQRAFLPQSRHDAFAYTVLDTVLAARYPHSATRYWEAQHDHAAALAALQACDVAALAARDVRTLSGGERQRVALAAALAQDAPLLLADEPTAALDPAHQVSVMRLLAARTSHRVGSMPTRAVVLVSHDLNLVQRSATHALLLCGDGRWQAGTAAAMLSAPLLSMALGHPIDVIMHAGRPIFLARDAENQDAEANDR